MGDSRVRGVAPAAPYDVPRMSNRGRTAYRRGRDTFTEAGMSALDLNERDVQSMLRVTSGYGVGDVATPFPWELLHDLRTLVDCATT